MFLGRLDQEKRIGRTRSMHGENDIFKVSFMQITTRGDTSRGPLDR